MKEIRALHLASFSGNIGDIANHQAFYRQLKKLKDFRVEIEELEMRCFYKNQQKMKFDDEFVEYVNNFDLFIIGGGNFFELCWDYSETATTFDISPNLLRKITTPIYINAIGVDDSKGTSEGNIEKFRMFLKTLFRFNKVLFTVRNDGSFSIIQKYFNEFSNLIQTTPDWGFCMNEIDEVSSYQKRSKRIKSIGFNVAVDMSEMRYETITYKRFLDIVSNQINRILAETNYNIFLYPHIQTDFFAITDLLKLIDRNLVRSRVSIAPLIQGSELETFKLYEECDLIFAMRFHSNVCAMSLGVPTFGILSYPKHNQLYEELTLLNRKIDVNDSLFEFRIDREITNIIKNGDDYFMEIKKEYKEVKSKIDVEIEANLSALNQFLQEVI